jgi:hypothetical protein
MWKVLKPRRDCTSGDRLTQLEKKSPWSRNSTIMLTSQTRVDGDVREDGEDMVTQG